MNPMPRPAAQWCRAATELPRRARRSPAALVRLLLGLLAVLGLVGLLALPGSGPFGSQPRGVALAAPASRHDDDDDRRRATPTPRPTQQPTSTPVPPTATAQPTLPPATATPTAIPPTATATPPPTPTRAAEPTPTATEVPAPAPTATPTPSPLPLPPTATPVPTVSAGGGSGGSGSGGGGGTGGAAPEPTKASFVPLPATPGPAAASGSRTSAVAAPRAPAPLVASVPTDAGSEAALAALAPVRFVLGFAALDRVLAPITGVPVENEHGNADNCDTQQLTTTGLAYWRCSTNTMTFAAFPDGLHHWGWLDGRLVEWIGPTPDPPAGAEPVGCLNDNDRPETACLLLNGASLQGALSTPGSMRVYRFFVQPPEATVQLDLTELPADYDLYLVDQGNAVVAASVQEETSPETVQATLPAGEYYAYVPVDPGRTAEPDLPFTLSLAVSPTEPATALVSAGP